MMPVKIIAVGSPFGDDQIAWQIAEDLQNILQRENNISIEANIVTVDRPGVNLINVWQGWQNVCVIDAVIMDKAIGTVERFTVEQLNDYQSAIIHSSHDFGLQQTLQLASMLGQLPEKLIIYGIVISAKQQADLQKKRDKICNEILKYLIVDY